MLPAPKADAGCIKKTAAISSSIEAEGCQLVRRAIVSDTSSFSGRLRIEVIFRTPGIREPGDLSRYKPKPLRFESL